MDANEYQRLASRTDGTTAQRERLTNAALGLTGEAGEFADHVKKLLFHGHPFNAIAVLDMQKELGDVCWYIAQACCALDLDLGDVMENNIRKLSIRYPDKFNTADSLARRDVLEGQMD